MRCSRSLYTLIAISILGTLFAGAIGTTLGDDAYIDSSTHPFDNPYSITLIAFETDIPADIALAVFDDMASDAEGFSGFNPLDPISFAISYSAWCAEVAVDSDGHWVSWRPMRQPRVHRVSTGTEG